MKFKKTRIKGIYIIDRKNRKDKRGFFNKMFCQKTFKRYLKNKNIFQINRSFTKKKGTVRGLHFQNPPYAETKIISCIKGKVWDVAVDIRRGSPTFLKYYSIILSEEKNQSFFIPEGFAHGFQTLTDNCEMLYFHTSDYNLISEGSISATDKVLNIKWPKKITFQSKRDYNNPNLDANFLGIKINEL